MAQFEVVGIDRTINAVKRLSTNLITAFREGANITLEKAQQVAQDRYNNAEYDGVNDAMVKSPKWLDKTRVELTATGKSLLFIEFGAGIRYYYPVNPYANKFNYSRGGYGKGLAQQRKGLWIYKTKPGNQLNGRDGSVVLDREKVPRDDVAWTGGNPATNGMYEALKVIQQELAHNIMLVVLK